MRVIDLSIELEPDLPQDPPEMVPHFQFMDHSIGIKTMMDTFGCSADVLPKEGLCAHNVITCSDHSGTHMDAPLHYSPVTDDRRLAQSIETLPLEDYYGDGGCIHFQDKPDGYRIMPEDLEEYFSQVGYTVKPGNIVLLHTGAYAKSGRTAQYMLTGCGMSRAAALWLCERGVKVVGTDAWSWDRPLPLIKQDYAVTHDPSLIWEGHLAGRTMPYFQMEKMNNLDKLPPFGFRVIAAPIRIKHGTAGWVRPLAFMDD